MHRRLPLKCALGYGTILDVSQERQGVVEFIATAVQDKHPVARSCSYLGDATTHGASANHPNSQMIFHNADKGKVNTGECHILPRWNYLHPCTTLR